ncbi:EVE domain-containing protein [soil metagenome]
MARAPHYWLMKSEPDVFSLTELKKVGKTLWTGVRNYQARNYMLGRAQTKALVEQAVKEKKKLADSMTTASPLTMEAGDHFLFYHSNATPAACVGVGRIENVGVADPEQFNGKLEGFEPKASKLKPMWFCAEVSFEKEFAKPVSLDTLRADAALAKMLLLQKGSRLSVQPVTQKEFEHVVKLGGGK